MDSDVSKLANAISKLAEVHDRRLGEIGKALESLAHHTKYLGSGSAATEQGALEYLSGEIGSGFTELAEAIREVGQKRDDVED